MSRCQTQCNKFYKDPTDANFTNDDNNMSCAYCLSNDLEVNTGPYIDLECDCAQKLSSMEVDKNITFDQYNQIKTCLQTQGCSTNCKTLYNEILGSGCNTNTNKFNTNLNSGAPGSASNSSNNIGSIVGYSILAILAVGFGMWFVVSLRNTNTNRSRLVGSTRF